MCGIVGYIGTQDSVPILMEGLRRLEYRGYDSAGISVVADDALHTAKSEGKLENLRSRLDESPISGSVGIGHTRWATHGLPTEVNSHPHLDEPSGIAVVHNGIIENYQELGAWLRSMGVEFRSETDTETLAHLIRHCYDGDLFEAVKCALKKVKGTYAIGVVSREHPDLLVAARHGSPLILGLGEDAYFVTSDVTPLLEHTRRVVYLEDGQVCALTRGGYTIQDLDGTPQELEVMTVDWDASTAEKGGYPHYMLKEIHEQPEVLRNTLRGRISEAKDRVLLGDIGLSDEEIRECSRVVLVACGTAWHAALLGKLYVEKFARIPAEVDIASEFRYRELLIDDKTIVIVVSQSGETADTLEAMRAAKALGAKVVSVVNVIGSSIARESDGVVYLNAGIEIGVASTKAYTAQIAALGLLSLYFGQVRETIDANLLKEYLEALSKVPDIVENALELEEDIQECATDPRFRDAYSTFFIGRGFNYPSALEGALKLKEISYIHAEGYGAGEMKHGPIALVTDELPVICIATKSPVRIKTISNIQEIRAREGIVLSIATEGDEELASQSDRIIYVPECMDCFSPIINAVPMQLLSYHIAVHRGCDVDHPRNLAKSVTVE
ncbi:MAG: glutamine--fructose-6-phosphate transaminase (isomerizing) [Candidatus Hydrogenedentota bacterium]